MLRTEIILHKIVEQSLLFLLHEMKTKFSYQAVQSNKLITFTLALLSYTSSLIPPYS